MLSVPFHERYPVRGQFLYDDIPYLGIVTRERLQKITDFEVREDDICLASYPRTGTRWTAEILSWIIRDGDEEKMKTFETNLERSPYLEMRIPEEKNIVDDPGAFNFTDRPRLYTTHLPFNMAPKQLAHKGRIVCVFRNPKDCAVSYYHFYRMDNFLGAYDGPWGDFLQGFRRGELVWGSYFKFVTSWWTRRDQENILFVRYEEMKKTPGEHVKKMAEFLGKSLSQSTIDLIVNKTSFESMKKNPDTNISINPKMKGMLREIKEEFIRKGEVGDWKNYFTVAQNEVFDELIEAKLKNTGLEFEY